MAAPIRGTQSFVGIMGKVWRRPSLTALEMAWRWPIGLLMIIPLWQHSGSSWMKHLDELQSEAVIALHGGFIYSVRWSTIVPAVLTLVLIWNYVAANGRAIVLRRLDSTLHAGRLTLFLLGTLRALLLGAAWGMWLWGLSYAARTAITAPAARGEDPSLVLFAAMLICGTLALYVLWAVFSWFLQLAPLLAMKLNLGPIAALRAAIKSPRALRGKLIEINLVMNIVRIALIVLAMVFSASPLPFSSVETQTFLTCWWIGVGVFWLVASDYFHVVRAAAYLSLYRVYAEE